jgi:hypothetical protein
LAVARSPARANEDQIQPPQPTKSPINADVSRSIIEKQPMIVVIAGMPRSGSTFTLNIARETLIPSGEVASIYSESLAPALSHRKGEAHLIIKAHGTDATLGNLIKTRAAVCICSFRKPEEAVASLMRVFGYSFEKALAAIGHWLKWHAAYAQFAINIDYNEIVRRPLQSIFKIQRCIGGAVSIDETLRLRQQYDREQVAARTNVMVESENTTNFGFSYSDNTTHFHRRHVSPPDQRSAKDTLNAQQIILVRTQLDSFLDENGEYWPKRRSAD